MGNPHDEVGVRPGMTLSTGLYEARIRDEGFWIFGRKDAVKTMAVCAAGYQFGVPQMFHLSMVAFIIGLSSDHEDLVSLHHLLIRMALLADLCMKLLPGLDHLRFIAL
jgi:hypothetical protein